MLILFAQVPLPWEGTFVLQLTHPSTSFVGEFITVLQNIGHLCCFSNSILFLCALVKLISGPCFNLSTGHALLAPDGFFCLFPSGT